MTGHEKVGEMTVCLCGEPIIKAQFIGVTVGINGREIILPKELAERIRCADTNLNDELKPLTISINVDKQDNIDELAKELANRIDKALRSKDVMGG